MMDLLVWALAGTSWVAGLTPGVGTPLYESARRFSEVKEWEGTFTVRVRDRASGPDGEMRVTFRMFQSASGAFRLSSSDTLEKPLVRWRGDAAGRASVDGESTIRSKRMHVDAKTSGEGAFERRFMILILDPTAGTYEVNGVPTPLPVRTSVRAEGAPSESGARAMIPGLRTGKQRLPKAGMVLQGTAKARVARDQLMVDGLAAPIDDLLSKAEYTVTWSIRPVETVARR